MLKLSSEQLDSLLNPYCSQQEIVKKWKDTLQELNQPTTTKGMEWLAQKMKSEFNIPPSAISSLFNRKYTDPLSDSTFGKTPNLRIFFNPISFSGTEQFKYSDEDFVSSLRKRLEYPILPKEINKFYIGPTNSDLDSDLKFSKWCHEDNSDNFGFHHGMMKCQCYQEIPDLGFTCEGCKGFFRWKSIGTDWSETEVIRFPIIDEKLGGWGGFFCSRSCILEFPPEEITEMHDIIIEAIDSIIEED